MIGYYLDIVIVEIRNFVFFGIQLGLQSMYV